MRILEHEARLHQRVLPVQRHALQEHHALGVDVHADVVELQDAIGRARLRIELEQVAQPRAAAAADAQAQPSRTPSRLKASRILSTALGVTVTIAKENYA